MKVVIAGPYLLNGKKNGIIVHVYNLAKFLSQVNNVNIHIVTLGNKNGTVAQNDITIHIVKRVFNDIDTPLDAFELARIIAQINPDIVHSHGSWYPYSTAGILLHRRYNTVLSIHGNIKYEAKMLRTIGIRGYLAGITAILNEIISVKFIKHLIIPTFATKDYLPLAGNVVSIIPNGFDFSDEYFLKSQYCETKSSDIIYIANLTFLKGVDVLIKSISLVQKEIPAVKVLIGGIGPLENEMKNKVKDLCLEKNITFLGYIDRLEKYSFLKSSKVCIVPSRSETFGITILEAMACKKPVIASNVGGIPYVIENGKTGLLFKSTDEYELAERIIFLLNNDYLMANMGIQGEKRVKDMFQWDHVAKKTLELYENILNS